MMSTDFVKPSMRGDPDRGEMVDISLLRKSKWSWHSQRTRQFFGSPAVGRCCSPCFIEYRNTSLYESTRRACVLFLPLPRDSESPTGLRFHVHGYFAVDQNRRHIKKRSAEQYGAAVTDEAILWNEYLIGNLLSKALIKAMEYATSLSRSDAALFDMICSSVPEIKLVKQEWRPFAEAFLQELPKLAVFYSPVKGGRYSVAKDALFDSVEDTSSCTKTRTPNTTPEWNPSGVRAWFPTGAAWGSGPTGWRATSVYSPEICWVIHDADRQWSNDSAEISGW